MSTPAEPDREPQPPEGPAEIKAQRDMYLKAFYALTRIPFTLTEEERREMEESGRTLEQVIKELEESKDA
jgi:hypothetical protein